MKYIVFNNEEDAEAFVEKVNLGEQWRFTAIYRERHGEPPHSNRGIMNQQYTGWLKHPDKELWAVQADLVVQLYMGIDDSLVGSIEDWPLDE